MSETMESIKTFVLALVEAKAKLPAGVDVDSFNYIDSGHVDSIGIIKFVLGIESRYGVEVGEDDMLSPAFRTVGGLVAMIEGKVAARHAPAPKADRPQ